MPIDQIDNHVRSNESVSVRRWMPNDYGEKTLSTLDRIGYSGADEVLDNHSEKVSKRKTTTLISR